MVLNASLAHKVRGRARGRFPVGRKWLTLRKPMFCRGIVPYYTSCATFSLSDRGRAWVEVGVALGVGVGVGVGVGAGLGGRGGGLRLALGVELGVEVGVGLWFDGPSVPRGSDGAQRQPRAQSTEDNIPLCQLSLKRLQNSDYLGFDSR